MRIIFFLLSMIINLPVQASVTYGQDFTNIGVSSFIYETSYAQQEVKSTWSPFIAFQYNDFFIRDVEIGYQFITTYDYGAAISLSGDELNKQRKGEGSANDGLNFKSSFSLYRQSGIYTLTAMRDISGVHDGTESTLSWLYTLRNLNLTWYPSIYVSWMDVKLVKHYFSSENKASGWRYGIGATIDYHPHQRWLFQTVVTNESYSAEVTDSPIVERSNVWLLTLNLGYYF